jgi:hypothetical protein
MSTLIRSSISQPIKKLNLAISTYYLFEFNDWKALFFLTQVIEINQVQQEVIVQYYKHGFSNSSYIKFFNKTDNKLKIDWQDIVVSLVDQLVSNRRNQLSLSKEQFGDIQNFCR